MYAIGKSQLADDLAEMLIPSSKDDKIEGCHFLAEASKGMKQHGYVLAGIRSPVVYEVILYRRISRYGLPDVEGRSLGARIVFAANFAIERIGNGIY